jgi:hypothetical protein
MIAFSTVDGHKKEYEFLFLIANQLNIEKGGLMIYFIKNYQSYLKNEFQRIQQFYRLALLMHRDGILHVKQKPLNKLLFVWV